MSMTMEQAIQILKNYLAIQKEFKALPDYIEALEMAIQFIEQQHCTDCISRQAVLDINESHHWQMPNHINHQIWQEIKDLPPVPTQPKMGHWIKYGKVYQCSECKELSCCQGKFCNECGAKMVEPQESENK